MKTMTHTKWIAEGRRRFGDDVAAWRFTCPSCGHVASVRDWQDAIGKDAMKFVAFSCVGRWTDADDSKTFKMAGGPCTYAGGGMFRLNPVEVDYGDGKTVKVFDFAEETP